MKCNVGGLVIRRLDFGSARLQFKYRWLEKDSYCIMNIRYQLSVNEVPNQNKIIIPVKY